MSSEKQGCPEVDEFAIFWGLSEGKLPLHLELGYNLVRIPDKI